MQRPHPVTFVLRIVWTLVLIAHVVLAGLVLRLLPHGFPWLHARTVLGTFLPWALIVYACVTGVLLWASPRASKRALPAVPAFWASIAIGLVLFFPQTGWTAARVVGLIALPLGVFTVFTCHGLRVVALLSAVLVGVALGTLTAYCERPDPASTHPWGSAPPVSNELGEAAHSRFELATDLVVESAEPRVTWRGARAVVSIVPLLTFDRISPDGFWSRFAPAGTPSLPIVTASKAQNRLELWDADGTVRLSLRRRESSEPRGRTELVDLEAFTALERPVYSHLNTFTSVTINGHGRLGVRFSPIPDEVIEFTYADYPFGAPARFAYVDAERRFRVVEASDAEKGPFRTLAEGMLDRADVLAVDLVELDEPRGAFVRLEFQDFASMLSTELSPAAGYGVAQNAIQFGLGDTSASSQAHLLFTLAATGVGLGWDSVGHSAGTYPNRMVLRSLEPLPPPAPSVPLHDLSKVCTAIARDIAALKQKHPQLVEFDPTQAMMSEGECIISYAYHTHRSTRPGGWAAQVPNPDPDGLWFHVGLWDPRGPARHAQINTQPGLSVFTFGEDNVTLLILDGKKAGTFPSALRRVLARHGMGRLR